MGSSTSGKRNNTNPEGISVIVPVVGVRRMLSSSRGMPPRDTRKKEPAVTEQTEAPGPETPEDKEISDHRIARLITQLLDDDPVARWRAAEMLGRAADPVAVAALIDSLWDDDARVRLKAAWALGEIGDERAIPALRRLYRIEKEDTREIIQEALESINRDRYSG